MSHRHLASNLKSFDDKNREISNVSLHFKWRARRLWEPWILMLWCGGSARCGLKQLQPGVREDVPHAVCSASPAQRLLGSLGRWCTNCCSLLDMGFQPGGHLVSKAPCVWRGRWKHGLEQPGDKPPICLTGKIQQTTGPFPGTLSPAWLFPLFSSVILGKGRRFLVNYCFFQILQFLLVFCFFPLLGFELRAFTLSHPPAFFCDEFFEIGSHKLFVQAGFEHWSSYLLSSYDYRREPLASGFKLRVLMIKTDHRYSAVSHPPRTKVGVCSLQLQQCTVIT
jgi:hypothetical protein